MHQTVVNWQPTIAIEDLYKRSTIINKIRTFFAQRDVMEVETPMMSQATVTDVNLSPFETHLIAPGYAQGQRLFLMTSPEYHMKRLLVAGSGPIYQLGRCFRNEEAGRHHNPEFTMLEWYRPGLNMHQLIDEVDTLLRSILHVKPAERLSYQQLFKTILNIDPLVANRAELRAVATQLNLASIAQQEEDRDTLLQLLFAFGIEHHIGIDRPVVVYHFPASQASLAALESNDQRVALRFEVYFKGIELANGFEELTDANEQRQRFMRDNQQRLYRGLVQQPLDENLLAALTIGLPECSGVALGVDRLIMLALGKKHIQEVIAFTVDNA